MAAIWDCSMPFNSQLFEQTIAHFNNPNSQYRTQAERSLIQLKEDTRCYLIADRIISECKDARSQYFGLELIDNIVKYQWSIIPEQAQSGIRQMALNSVLSLSGCENKTENQQIQLERYDRIIVNLYTKEYPNQWQSLIDDIINSATSSEIVSENHMHIIKLIIEDVYEFSESQIQSDRVSVLKNDLKQHFGQLFSLCSAILTHTTRQSLLSRTFLVLLSLLTQVDNESMKFDPSLVQIILRFVIVDGLRCDAIDCLYEVLTSPRSSAYPALVLNIFSEMGSVLSKLFPNTSIDLSSLSFTPSAEVQSFINALTRLLAQSLPLHKLLLLQQFNQSELLVHLYSCLFVMSTTKSQENFKQCVIAWNDLSKYLVSKYSRKIRNQGSVFGGERVDERMPAGVFTSLTQQVIDLLIFRMYKPEEVLVNVNEYGEIIRESVRDSETVVIHKLMSETLVNLANIDYDICEAIVMKRLDEQMQLSDSVPFHEPLQHLVWSIGCLPSVTNGNEEKKLVVTTLHDLLTLVKKKSTQEDKAVVAACIMYVIQMFPRYLREQFSLLRTVLNRNFQFMTHSLPAVREMACSTFCRLAKMCGKPLVMEQKLDNEVCRPFIETILTNKNEYIKLLNHSLIEDFYGSVCYIIRCEPAFAQRQKYIQVLLQSLNEEWKSLILLFSRDLSAVCDIETVRRVKYIIRVCTVCCEILSKDFYEEFNALSGDVLIIFKLYSENINSSIRTHGVNAAGYLVPHTQIGVKRDFVQFFVAFINGMNYSLNQVHSSLPLLNPESYDVKKIFSIPVDNWRFEWFCEMFAESLLNDFAEAPDCAKESCILKLFCLVIEKMNDRASGLVNLILQKIFMSVLKLMNECGSKLPDIRLEFYRLLNALAAYSYDRLMSFNEQEIEQIIRCVCMGLSMHETIICETSCNTLLCIIRSNRTRSSPFTQTFYRMFFLYILDETFQVMLGRMHVFALPLQTEIIQLLLSIMSNYEIMVPLLDSVKDVRDNEREVYSRLSHQLSGWLPQVSNMVIWEYVQKLRSVHSEKRAFCELNRDLLINSREITKSDFQELQSLQFEVPGVSNDL